MEQESLRGLHLKSYDTPKSKFRKYPIEITTTIAHEINKLRLQILKALYIYKETKNNRIKFENSDNVLKLFLFFF